MRRVERIVSFLLLINSFLFVKTGIGYFFTYTKKGFLWLFIVEEVITFRLILVGLLGFLIGVKLFFKGKLNFKEKSFIVSYFIILLFYHLFLLSVINRFSVLSIDFIQIFLILVVIVNELDEYKVIIRTNLKRILFYFIMLGIVPFLISLFFDYQLFR